MKSKTDLIDKILFIFRNSVLVSLVAGMLVFQYGCSQGELTEIEHIQKAKDFIDKGDLRSSVLELKNVLQKNPDNAEARLILGRTYVKIGNAAAAEKEFQKARELEIPVQEMFREYGYALLMQGKYQALLDNFPMKLAGTDQDRALLSALYAWAFLGQGEIKKSIEAATRSLNLNASETEAMLALAQADFMKGDFDEVSKRLDEIIGIDSDNPRALLFLADFKRSQGDYADAIKAYSRVLENNSYNLAAHLGKAQAALAANDLEEAQHEAEEVLKYAKSHPLANFIQGIVAFQKEEYNMALSKFQVVEKVLPGFKPVLFWLGLSHAVLGHNIQASEMAGRYLQEYPDSVAARKLMAAIDLDLNKPDEALSRLEGLKQAGLKDAQYYNLLGEAYAGIGDFSQSAESYHQAIGFDAPSVRMRLGYAMTLLQQDKPDQALEQLMEISGGDSELIEAEGAVIQKMVEKGYTDQAMRAVTWLEKRYPDDPRLLNMHGGIMLNLGQTADAEKTFRKAVEIDSGYAPAVHNLALLELHRGNVTQAREYYIKLLDVVPNHVPTLLALYNIDRRDKQEQAITWLDRAVTAQPDHTVAATLLAREYLSRNNALKALAISEQAIAAHPNDSGLLEVRGKSQLEIGEAANAFSSFERLAGLQPNVADAFFYKAQALAAMGKVDETRQALEKALSLNGQHLGARLALARLELMTGDTKAADAQAKIIQQRFPDSQEGRIVEYDVRIQQHRYDEAIKIIQQLLNDDHVNTANVLRLARAMWANGEKEQALERVKSWVKLHNNDIESLLFLAQSEEQFGRLSNARQHYEAILKLVPDDAIALNNLAWLLRQQDVDRASRLARQAHDQNPNQPEYAATLAEILMLQGNKDQEILRLLSPYVQTEADLPQLQYLYANALLGAGNKQEAKGVLRRALASNAEFPGRQTARKLLDQLGE